MKEIKSKQTIAGKWYRATDFETCCDCGLTHRKEWKIIVRDKKLNILLAKHKGEIKLFQRMWRGKESKEN